MSEEFMEYDTFHITTKDGEDVELAVVDEFEFEKKHYVAGAVIEGDCIKEEELYIYALKVSAEDFEVEKITDPKEYEKVANAYLEMES